MTAVFAALDALPLQPAPIEPSWVLRGDPRAQGALHSSTVDGWASAAVWECSAGSFRWHFAWEETVHVLSGAVRVTGPDGATRELRAGDVGYFPAGTWWVWEIDDHVRKLAFCRREVPVPVRGVGALLAQLKARRTARLA